jgi:hypothetical protein
MARLYDRLIDRPQVSALNGATVVIADNVAAYLFAESGRDWDSWTLADMPTLAPPLSNIWVEARAPECKRAEGEVHGFEDHFRAWGAHFVAEDQGPEALPGRWHVSALLWLDTRPLARPLPAFLRSGMSDRLRRFYDALGGVLGPVWEVSYWVDRSGSLVPHSAKVQVHPFGDVKAGLIEGMFTALLLAIGFMHCKNVERREVEQSRWDRREWKRKHGRPLVRYHVLDIDPMRKVLRTEGKSDEVGLKKALHICRGHFATYTDSMFGRPLAEPVTVWRPQHVRGSAKNGAVVKDYNVKEPRP